MIARSTIRASLPSSSLDAEQACRAPPEDHEAPREVAAAKIPAKLVSEGRYVDGKTHGVWLAFSLRRTFAFATCLEHGEKRWQLTSHELTEAEALSKSCP